MQGTVHLALYRAALYHAVPLSYRTLIESASRQSLQAVSSVCVFDSSLFLYTRRKWLRAWVRDYHFISYNY